MEGGNCVIYTLSIQSLCLVEGSGALVPAGPPSLRCRKSLTALCHLHLLLASTNSITSRLWLRVRDTAIKPRDFQQHNDYHSILIESGQDI